MSYREKFEKYQNRLIRLGRIIDNLSYELFEMTHNEDILKVFPTFVNFPVM